MDKTDQKILELLDGISRYCSWHTTCYGCLFRVDHSKSCQITNFLNSMCSQQSGKPTLPSHWDMNIIKEVLEDK